MLAKRAEDAGVVVCERTRRLLDRGRLITQWTEAYARLLEQHSRWPLFRASPAVATHRSTRYGSRGGRRVIDGDCQTR
jgi:hypothetical protein